jgi:protocatechuate 3,4-dioxygenase beta subunit
LDTRGEALEDARVEVWHADHFGKYDIEGYRFRAQIPLEGKGTYHFGSVMPGHYPDRVCQHVHYLVSAPGAQDAGDAALFCDRSGLRG